MQPRFESAWATRRSAWSCSPVSVPGSTSCACVPTCGEVEEALAEWWQDFQTADDERRDDPDGPGQEEQRARQKAQQQAQPVVRRVPKGGPGRRAIGRGRVAHRRWRA